MDDDGSLAFGLDFDRDYLVSFVKSFRECYWPVTVFFVHPFTIFVLIRKSPMSFDCKCAFITHHITLMCFDFYNGALYQMYPLAPIPVFICTGLLCNGAAEGTTLLMNAPLYNDRFEEVKRSKDHHQAPLVISPIETLPRELIWEIIEEAPEMVLLLRLTSRSMNSYVNEYVMQRGAMSIVKELRIDYRGPMNTVNIPVVYCVQIKIFVSVQKMNLLKLRILLRKPPFSPKKPIKLCRCKLEHKISMLTVYLCKDDTTMLEFLGDCIGRRIYPHLKWDGGGLSEGKGSSAIYKQIFSEFLTNPIHIDHLSLQFRTTTVSDPVGSLLKLSSKIRSIRLDQLNDFDTNEGPINSFFGIENVEWAPIIIDMYAGKLDKLSINNFAGYAYLSHKCAQSLTKNLTKINKKIWFETISKNFPEGLKYTDDDYVVEADRSSRYRSYLRIKHFSRKDETPSFG